MSTLIATTLQTTNVSDGTNTIPATYVTGGSAKAWGTISGVGTVTLLESLNLSSITDVTTGRYGFTLTNAVSDIDACVNSSYAGASDAATGRTTYFTAVLFTTSEVRWNAYATSQQDVYRAYMSVMGDLA
jgi:predicted metalloprotease